MGIAEYSWDAPYWLKWLVANKRKCLSNHRSRMLSLIPRNGIAYCTKKAYVRENKPRQKRMVRCLIEGEE